MRKWITHWEIWVETIVAAVILMAVYLIFQNLAPIWHGMLHFMGVVRPFFIGFAIAYVLNAPSSKLESMFRSLRMPFAKVISVLITYLLALALLGLVAGVLLPIWVMNAWDFLTQLPLYLNPLLANLGGNEAVASSLMETLKEWVGDLTSLQEVFSRLGILGEYALIMTSGLFDAFIGMVISIYMLVSKNSLIRFWNRILELVFKPSQLRALKDFVHQANHIFYTFIVCKLIAGTILGTLSGLVFYFLGVRYALMLALVVGICNLVPYIGAMVSFTLTVVIAFFSGGPMMALLAGVFLMLLQQVDDNFIQPRLVGEALDLNPIMIIFAITIGGAYFGISGMLLSVPLAAIIKVFVGRALGLDK